MVQFPRYRFRELCIHPRMDAIQDVRVTPFGHPRISGCLLLPVAFRSLPRPSSPDSSKASPANLYSLDHITPQSTHNAFYVVVFARLELSVFRRMQVAVVATSIGRQLLFPSLFGATRTRCPKAVKDRPQESAVANNEAHRPAGLPRRRNAAGYVLSEWRYGDSNPRPMACKAIALAI